MPAAAGAGNLSMRAKISAVAPTSGPGRPAACAIAAGDGKFPETPEYSAAGHGNQKTFRRSTERSHRVDVGICVASCSLQRPLG